MVGSTNGDLLCMKNFFKPEKATFCVWKTFLIPKWRPFVHENLFWYRNGGLLYMKNFFNTETAAFCTWKTLLIPKWRPFVYENLFWSSNGDLLCSKKYLFTEMFGTLTRKIYFCAEMVDVLMAFRLWTEKSWKSILVRPSERYHYLPFDKQMLNP